MSFWRLITTTTASWLGPGTLACVQLAREPLAHPYARRVKAYQLDLPAVPSVFLGNGIQHRNGGSIPNMRGVQVDDHVVDSLRGILRIVELRVEVVGGGEEQ